MPAPPEALLICSVCRQGVPQANYEEHLRLVHRLWTYRGVRRSIEETVELILTELLTTRPSPDAWQTLLHIARNEHVARADEALAALLAESLHELPEDKRDAVIANLAPLLSPSHPDLVAALASHPRPAGRTLALACHAFLPPTVASLPALMGDRELSADLQLRILEHLWPSLDDALTAKLLDQIIEGLGRASSIKRLRLVERRVGKHPAITSRLEDLWENARLTCPRCGLQQRRAAMEQHLWQEHRLVLDKQECRDPWTLIEQWLDDAQQGLPPGPVALVARSRIAANKIDPEGGPVRVARLILSRRLVDAESSRLLLGLAGERHASCCPHCFAFVPVPVEAPVPFVNLREGRLSSLGYEVRIDERGLRPRLLVRTPEAVIYEGGQPGRRWTNQGLATLIAAPAVLLALGFATLWPVSLGRPIKAVIPLILLGIVAYTCVRAFTHLRGTPFAVVRHAWRFLVPRLHAQGFSQADAAFSAGLALMHTRRAPATRHSVGMIGVKADQLARLVRVMEQALGKGMTSPGYHAPLCRLWVEKEVEDGQDPVPLVADLVARAFEGRLPLSFVQDLLGGWAAPWWTNVALARLRVLLCDAAFEASFEVHSLLDAGQTAPALGTVLGIKQPRDLAALRLLWSLRATRPWDKLRDVKTVFELAADEKSSGPLGQSPDLLLWAEYPSWLVAADGFHVKPAAIRLTTVGVWLQEALFRVPPREFEIRALDGRRGEARWVMILGRDVFHGPDDLDPLSRELERWFRHAFNELLPMVDQVLEWRAPDQAAVMRAWGAVPCPECGRHLLPRAGEVGMACAAEV